MMESRNYTVYIHTSPSSKHYVGITCLTTNQRWRSDGSGYKRNGYFWKAICRWGWENITHRIIAEGLSEEAAKQIEIDFIRVLDTKNPSRGYNLTLGGDGSMGYHHSDAAKHKMRIGHLGMTCSKETRDKMSRAKIGKGKSKETRERMRRSSARKPVIQYFDGNEIARFESTAEAERRIGINNQNIAACCRGERQHAGGYEWAFTEE